MLFNNKKHYYEKLLERVYDYLSFALFGGKHLPNY
jgi:hypothetical protein